MNTKKTARQAGNLDPRGAIDIYRTRILAQLAVLDRMDELNKAK